VNPEQFTLLGYEEDGVNDLDKDTLAHEFSNAPLLTHDVLDRKPGLTPSQVSHSHYNWIIQIHGYRNTYFLLVQVGVLGTCAVSFFFFSFTLNLVLTFV
jgi:hypothetical protein